MIIKQTKSLVHFEFWAGGKDRAEILSTSELEEVERVLEELYPDGIDETTLNDIFWFDLDWIAELLGYENEEELWEERRNET